jgi:hypothetical protein
MRLLCYPMYVMAVLHDWRVTHAAERAALSSSTPARPRFWLVLPPALRAGLFLFMLIIWAPSEVWELVHRHWWTLCHLHILGWAALTMLLDTPPKFPQTSTVRAFIRGLLTRRPLASVIG